MAYGSLTSGTQHLPPLLQKKGEGQWRLYLQWEPIFGATSLAPSGHEPEERLIGREARQQADSLRPVSERHSWEELGQSRSGEQRNSGGSPSGQKTRWRQHRPSSEQVYPGGQKSDASVPFPLHETALRQRAWNERVSGLFGYDSEARLRPHSERWCSACVCCCLDRSFLGPLGA